MKNILFALSFFGCSVCFSQITFTHTSDAANINGNSTSLNAGGLNNNPKAIVIATQVNESKQLNPNAIGLWYDGSKWNIYNQNKVTMPAGVSFSVQFFPAPNTNQFLHTAAVITNGGTYIDHPDLNNNPTADIAFSHIWNPQGGTGVYNNAFTSITYHQSNGKWFISNTNNIAMTQGVSFAIFIRNGSQAKKTITTPADVPVEIIPVKTNPIAQIKPAFITNTSPVMRAEDFDNWSFENGLQGWNATGNAFTSQPAQGKTIVSERALPFMQYASGGLGGDYWQGMQYEIGVKGNKWVGTYEKGQGDPPTGTLESAAFICNTRYIHFLLGGGNDFNRLYVELQVKKSDYEAVWGSERRSGFGETTDGFIRIDRKNSLLNSEELFRYWFDLDVLMNHQHLQKTYRLVINDNSSRAWGHINADDFKFTDAVVDFIPVTKDGFGLHADKDKPVWGFADTHTHPANFLGFGGRVIVGNFAAPLDQCYGSEECRAWHSGDNVFHTNSLFFASADAHENGKGYPDFIAYPAFYSKTHQRMHNDFIKRAWQGGLRVLVAMGVNNMYLANNSLVNRETALAHDDESSGLRQIEAIKNWANRERNWVEIALTPQDARRIILSGKLAVILGLEIDHFGNFGLSTYKFTRENNDNALIALNDQNATSLITDKIDQYYRLGLRYFTPLHYIDGAFGGVAHFNHKQAKIQQWTNHQVNLTSGTSRGINYNIFEDYDMPGTTYPDFCAAITLTPGTDDRGGLMCSNGLTAYGRTLITGLMKKGMLVDADHGSTLSKDDIFTLANSLPVNYPINSSHTDPMGLTFGYKNNKGFRGWDDWRYANFGTKNAEQVTHEGQVADEHLDGTSSTGGLSALLTIPKLKNSYTGSLGTVVNDCPGSTKTFAQSYLYLLEKMGGKPIGIATDFGMVDGLAPRFGTFAAWTIKDASVQNNIQVRVNNILAQKNTKGIRYDVNKITSYFPERVLLQLPGGGWLNGEIPHEFVDAWKALLFKEAHPFNSVAEFRSSGLRADINRMQDFLTGLYANNISEIDADNWEQSLIYCAKNNFDPNLIFAGRNHTSNKIFERPALDFLKDVLSLYNAMRAGNNAPLRKCITASRDWDFNIDGLAHYGMLPDMLQDLKTIGFDPALLKPILNSAEAFIKMWEKAETVKTLIQ